MATVVWQGRSPGVAQESRATPATVEIGDIFTLTCGAQSVSYTAAAATVADVTAGLTAAWNASTAGEIAEVTASDQTTYVELLADTAGVPFTVTSSTTNGGAADTQTLTMSTPTASAGPNDYSTAANWSTGAVPVANDDVVFENSSVSCLYGLAQSGTAVDTVTVKQSFTGYLGLPRENANGYVEYREDYLETGADVSIDIGEGEGTGSGRIKIKAPNLTGAFAINVQNSGTAAETGIPAVLITTGTQSNTTTLTVNKGDVGVAFFAGETAEIDVLNVGYVDRQASDSDVVCGSGITGGFTTINKSGGTLAIENNVTTVRQIGGETSIGGTATVSILNVYGGTVYYNSTGTCTTAHIGGGGTLDLRQSGASKVFSNTNIYETGAIYDPLQTATWSNGIDLERCSINDVTLDIGTHTTISLSAV